MKTESALSPSDFDFFRKVASSAFLNPFSLSRLEADRAAAGGVGEAGDVLPVLLEALSGRLARLGAEVPRPLLGRFRGRDRAVLRVGIAFLVFHRYVEAFDRYIVEQCRNRDEVLPCPFAGELFRELLGYGFDRADAIQTVAFFFQLRRAFYFINTALLGESALMRRTREALWQAVFTCDTQRYLETFWCRMEDFSILLLGETGTGKGAAAWAIGNSGFIPFQPERGGFKESFMNAFIPVNLSAFSENLIESELFGHRKGAFTGAIEHHAGVFSRCSPCGAIFLDEIGEVSESVQIKLLNVLQQRSFSPVGGHESERFEGRIIAATNRDLAERRKEGHFRDDFYYRLSSCSIVMPTLRERLAEVPGELETLLGNVLRRMTGAEHPEIVQSIQMSLRTDLPPDYPWPGNVRELEQAVRSVLLTGHYCGDRPAGAVAAPLPGEPPSEEGAALFERCREGTVTLEELQRGYASYLFKRYGSYGEVSRRLGVDWRTAKKFCRPE